MLHESEDTKKRLILAGIEELNSVGIEHFSTRSAAKRCNVSYNTPYKHFRNTQDYINEIFGYIDNMFSEQQQSLLHELSGLSLRERLVEISMAYIQFLTEHPDFYKVIIQKNRDCDPKYKCLSGELSITASKLVGEYCEQQNMSPDIMKRKLFVIRSFIYGAAFFFQCGKMENSDENRHMVRFLLDREFDLS